MSARAVVRDGRGNIDCDPENVCDIADLTALIEFLFVTFEDLCCPEASNIDEDAENVVDIADLTAIINHLFVTFEETSSLSRKQRAS